MQHTRAPIKQKTKYQHNCVSHFFNQLDLIPPLKKLISFTQSMLIISLFALELLKQIVQLSSLILLGAQKVAHEHTKGEESGEKEEISWGVSFDTHVIHCKFEVFMARVEDLVVHVVGRSGLLFENHILPSSSWFHFFFFF